jgi:large subunit ribosomal protein L18
MSNAKDREERRKKKHKRVRKKVSGTPSEPRLFVYKSLRHIYAQLIDDFRNETITGASSQSPEIREEYDRGNREAAFEVGKLIAEKAENNNIDKVVFDRGGYPYQGRVEALADGAREGGLDF